MTKICIIAGNYQEALTWAKGQNLSPEDWFYPVDLDELNIRSNFHVLVVGTAGQNVPVSYFNKFYNLACARGRVGRK